MTQGLRILFCRQASRHREVTQLVPCHTASSSAVELAFVNMSSSVSTITCGIKHDGGASRVNCSSKKKEVTNDSLKLGKN